MPDYEQLYYKSQAQLADTIELLEQLTGKLKHFMENCEEAILTDDENDENRSA